MWQASPADRNSDSGSFNFIFHFPPFGIGLTEAFPFYVRTLKGVQNIIPVCAFLIFFYIKWRWDCSCQFHFLGQDQSTVALQAKMTVYECSLMNWLSACFPDRFLHYIGNGKLSVCFTFMHSPHTRTIVHPKDHACIHLLKWDDL